MLSGKTFLITGATGRLGCETVQRLEELGAEVLPVVLSGYPLRPKRVPWPGKTRPIVIETPEDLAGLPSPDYIINLHWCINRDLPFTEQLVFEVDHNIKRLAFFWQWLKDRPVKRFINISSIRIFSSLNPNPIDAGCEPRPLSPYGICKVTFEKFLDAYFHNLDIQIVHLRLCSVTAVGEHPSRLMSQLTKSALMNKKIQINAGHTSHILYIDDAVDLIINAALSANKRQYILAAEAINNDRIAEEYERISACALNAEFVDLMPGIVDPIFVTDLEELTSEWGRKTSLEKMIETIISSTHGNSDQVVNR